VERWWKKTRLAEAEVEYEDYTSDTVWVKFRIDGYMGAPGTNPRWSSVHPS